MHNKHTRPTNEWKNIFVSVCIGYFYMVVTKYLKQSEGDQLTVAQIQWDFGPMLVTPRSSLEHQDGKFSGQRITIHTTAERKQRD